MSVHQIFRVADARRVSERALRELSGLELAQIARTVKGAASRSGLMMALAGASRPRIGTVQRQADLVVVPVAWGRRQDILRLKMGSPVAVAATSSSRHARVLAACVSQALWGDDRALVAAAVEKSAAHALCAWLTSDIHVRAGSLLRLTFEDVRWDDEVLERIVLEGPRLESSPLAARLWSEHAHFRELKAMSPVLAGSVRPVVFALTHDGRMRLSLSDLREDETRAVVEAVGEEIVGLAHKGE